MLAPRAKPLDEDQVTAWACAPLERGVRAPARLGLPGLGADAARARDPRGAPVIGPNAVWQTLAALERRHGAPTMRAVRAVAELPSEWPEGMVPESWFLRLLDALRGTLAPEDAESVLAEGGARTAAYVAAHRIPRPVHRVLAWLPERLAIPMLLDAFRRHAWTFAGAGTFSVIGRHPGTIVLANAPTCRATRPPRDDGPTHGGSYYEAAFEGLLHLASPRARVREVACTTRGADACRFDIQLV